MGDKKRYKITVYLPVHFAVAYTIEVDDLEPETIEKEMDKKDASDWDYEPNFFEALGADFHHFIEEMIRKKKTKDSIVVIKDNGEKWSIS